MRQYETCFIVNPQTDDAAIERHVNAVREQIQNNGGTILQEDRMGTRRLAYPIQNLTQGYYTAMIFEGDGKLIQSLDRFLKLEDPYIRHLTIRWDTRKVVVRKKEEEDEGEGQAAEQQETEAPAPRPHGSGRREEASATPSEDEGTVESEPETQSTVESEPEAAEQATAEQGEPAPEEQPESEDIDKTE